MKEDDAHKEVKQAITNILSMKESITDENINSWWEELILLMRQLGEEKCSGSSGKKLESMET